MNRNLLPFPLLRRPEEGMIYFGGFTQSGSDLLPRRSLCWATYVAPPLGAFDWCRPPPAGEGAASDLVCQLERAGAGYFRCAGRRNWECPPDSRPGSSAARRWGLGPPAACTRRQFARAGRLQPILSTVTRRSRAQRFSSTAVYPPCPTSTHEPSPRLRIRARRIHWFYVTCEGATHAYERTGHCSVDDSALCLLP
jgi:hypothetical protein